MTQKGQRVPSSTGAEVMVSGFNPYLALGWRDSSLCEAALTHSSWAHEWSCGSNERLEFLGDSVLDLLVSTRLVERNPDWGPGQLSEARARLVCRATLGERARRLGLQHWIRLGVGAQRQGLASQPDVLGNALEALLGAAYLDGGLGSAERMAVMMGVVP